jgi:amino acid transporter
MSLSTSFPESVGYLVKRLLLGRPLVTEQLHSERLSKPVALGVLSPDCISSSAYGTEEMLVELLPYAGLAAFTIVLPITGVILVILVLMTLCYRQVVQVYTKIGGSYVVARENFGPRIAQIAAVALLIDYVVTVAVQSAAGTVAVVSAAPAAGPYAVEITIGVVLLICYGNLRGIREAGRIFALPTYLFIGSIGTVIVVGIIRELFGNLPMYHPERIHGVVPIGHGSGLIAGASILVVLRSFANGGSSLTGLEAISDGVSAFREPTGVNARKVLGVMAFSLGFLVAGVSWLAHVTHAAPYSAGYPSVISQEAQIVFGYSAFGHALFIVVQAASALILYTGANTSFNGFPYLASFVAADSFLPRQLTKRGHRLAFSNGIIVLTVASVILVAVARAKVNSLVPFYAIGVFTGFTMAGLGMARFHTRQRAPGWRRKFGVTLAGGLLSAVVVLIFAISKFTEGAWVVVLLFPILMAVLLRLNREYRAEAAILDRVHGEIAARPNYAHHLVFVLVNNLDLAVLEALRYARSLRPSKLVAVHFMIDSVHADRLRQRFDDLGVMVPLKIIDCPDRRVPQSAGQLVVETLASAAPNSGVTVLLPRRGYAPLLGRLLHDRTADRIARVVSRIPAAAATIVPFDVQTQIRRSFPHLPEERPTRALERWRDRLTGADPGVSEHDAPAPSEPDATAIGSLTPGRAAVVDGRLHDLTDEHVDGRHTVVGTLVDSTGSLTIELRNPPLPVTLEAGQLLRVTGRPLRGADQTLTMTDPAFQVLHTPDLPEAGPPEQ